jgi:8-oxo-dGTP diphosphatase
LRIRVAALVVRDGKILLARHVKEGRSAYLLPGGGIESGESAHIALARELREEADVACEIGDLRYVIEAIAPDGARHILQLVFAAALAGEPGASRDPRVAGCYWHRIEELRGMPLHPDAAKEIADDLEHRATALRYLRAPWRVH